MSLVFEKESFPEVPKRSALAGLLGEGKVADLKRIDSKDLDSKGRDSPSPVIVDHTNQPQPGPTHSPKAPTPKKDGQPPSPSTVISSDVAHPDGHSTSSSVGKSDLKEETLEEISLYTSGPVSTLPFTCQIIFPASHKANLVVQIYEPCTVGRLIQQVISSCFDTITESQLRELSSVLSFVVADSDGNPDEDCPALEENRLIHKFGVSNFLLTQKSLTPSSSLPSSTASSSSSSSSSTSSEPLEVGSQVLTSSLDVTLASLKPRKPSIAVGSERKSEGKSSTTSTSTSSLSSTETKDPVSCLLNAAEAGSLNIVQEILQRKLAGVDATGIDNWSCLHFAARKGHIAVVMYVIKLGADLECLTKTGWTPLHFAASQGYSEIADTLLSCGADPNKRDKEGRTPLYFAKEKLKSASSTSGSDDHRSEADRYKEVVEVLEEFGAEL